MRDFADRAGAALVVGGSGGLGLAVTRMLARRGSHVAVTYRSRPEAGAAAAVAAREWGVRASAYPLDLAGEDDAGDPGDVVARSPRSTAACTRSSTRPGRTSR